MRILLILCTSLLIALANTSFAQEEEPIKMRPGMSGEDTRMVTPAVQPGASRVLGGGGDPIGPRGTTARKSTSREKAGIIGDTGVQGRASSRRPEPQPGVSTDKAGIIGDTGVKRPGSQPPPEAIPITLP